MAASLSNTAGLAVASLSNHDRNEISIVIRFSKNQSYIIDIDANNTIKDLKEHVARESNISSRQISFVLGGLLLNDNSVLKDCDLGVCTTIHAFCWCDDGLNSGDVALKIPLPGAQGVQPVTESQIPEARESDVDVGESFPVHQSVAGGSDIDIREPLSRGHCSSATVGSDVDIREPFGRARCTAAAIGSDVDGAAGTHAREKTLGDKMCSRTVRQNECHRFFVFCKLCDCIRPAKLRLSCTECGNGAFILERGPSNWEDISSNTTLKGVCTTPSCDCNTPKFYLRCSQSHEGELEGTSVVLKHVQSNHRRIACIICEDVVSHILIFPCSLGHVICLECFRQYGSTCLSERRFVEHPLHGYTLPCPAGCVDSHIEESHHFILLGPEKYEHYKMFGAEEYVLQNGGVLCPAPGCGMGLFPEENERLIKCQECKYESCRNCRRAYHTGSCEDYFDSIHLNLSDLAIDDERAQRSCWETQSLSLIEETTKPCPGCQTKTERSGGCMHMVCSRCYQEWCWVCVKSWNRECQASHWFG
ncbi:unnamed protein product [Candidula unifasciata]|uniref:E3 ubiquitin-protein ligase parkin n=1 Tax=Candidula unifasciata TaxID=100452 RepID=A0A8S3YWG1_9EUPU|nr:unnamed protein product [Candidula unifasciata]